MKHHGRDEVIDLFKGFTILWVIHIHTVFWSGSYYLPNYIRELSLFIDVPIFFFLSGYLLFAGPRNIVLKRGLKQFKRLYLSYLFFTLAVFFVSLSLRYTFGRSIPNVGTMLFDIAAVKVIFSELRGFSWNLWFLQTYLLLVVVIPIFSFFKDSLLRNILLTVLLFAVFILLRKLNYTQLPVYVVFYSIIFFLGSVYRKLENRITMTMFFSIYLFVFLATFAYFYRDNFTFVLQNNKFPPSLPYFVYSLNFIMVFVFVKSFFGHWSKKLHPAAKRLLIWSSKEVFNLYLMQSVICSLPFLFIPLLKDSIPAFPLYCFTLSFNVVFSLFLVWGFTWLMTNPIPLVNRIKP